MISGVWQLSEVTMRMTTSRQCRSKKQGRGCCVLSETEGVWRKIWYLIRGLVEEPAGDDNQKLQPQKKKKKAAGVISHSRESRRRSGMKGREKDKLIRKEAMAIVAFVAQILREGT